MELGVAWERHVCLCSGVRTCNTDGICESVHACIHNLLCVEAWQLLCKDFWSTDEEAGDGEGWRRLTAPTLGFSEALCGLAGGTCTGLRDKSGVPKVGTQCSCCLVVPSVPTVTPACTSLHWPCAGGAGGSRVRRRAGFAILKPPKLWVRNQGVWHQVPVLPSACSRVSDDPLISRASSPARTAVLPMSAVAPTPGEDCECSAPLGAATPCAPLCFCSFCICFAVAHLPSKGLVTVRPSANTYCVSGPVPRLPDTVLRVCTLTCHCL